MTPEEMLTRYCAGQSASRIARDAGCSPWRVLNRIRAQGQEVRANQNERRLVRTSERLWELVDGLLLGDGAFDRKGALRLEQAEKRAGWVEQVAQQLNEQGVDTRIVSIPSRLRVLEGREIRSQPGLLLYTPCYVEFQEARQRWYPNGIKHVPRDIRITPYSVAHWFAGDGSSAPTGVLVFYTNSFSRAAVQGLIAKLKNELAVNASLGLITARCEWTIRINRRNEAVWLAELIRDELAECCLYKLRNVRPTKRF